MRAKIRFKISKDGSTEIQDVRVGTPGGSAAVEPRSQNPTSAPAERPGVGSKQDLQANPPIHEVRLNLSTNDAKNALHELQRDKAEQEALEMCPPWTSPTNPFMVVARKLTYSQHFYDKGTAFLNDRLNEYSLTPIPRNCKSMFGKFDGDIEPSFCLKMFISQNWFSDVKRAMLAFGREFKQQNVHFAYALGSAPPDQSAIESLPEDVSCEYAWQVEMNTPQDVTTIEKIAKKYKVFEYSLKGVGHVLLAYSTGHKKNPQLEMPEKFRQFERHLQSLFSVAGITNLESLVGKLEHPATTDNLTRHLSKRLSIATKFLMSEFESKPNDETIRGKLTWALVADLNRVIQLETLDDSTLFANVRLSPKAQELLKHRSNGSDLIKRNRSLLVEAYQTELSDASLIDGQQHRYIGLTNYGNGANGATHTYQEAGRLLKSQKAK